MDFLDQVKNTPVGKAVVAGTFAVATAMSGVVDTARDVVFPPAGAETLSASAVQAAPVTQQVLDEIQAANPKSFKFFDRLSTAGKNTVASFYQKFKEVDPKNLSEAIRQLTYVQSGLENNKQAISDLEKTGQYAPGKGPQDPSNFITALLGMPTYATLLAPTSEVGQVFGQYRAQAEWTYNQAVSLQSKLAAARGDSEAVKQAKLELAATKQKLAETDAKLAASQQRLERAEADGRRLNTILSKLK